MMLGFMEVATPVLALLDIAGLAQVSLLSQIIATVSTAVVPLASTVLGYHHIVAVWVSPVGTP